MDKVYEFHDSEVLTVTREDTDLILRVRFVSLIFSDKSKNEFDSKPSEIVDVRLRNFKATELPSVGDIQDGAIFNADHNFDNIVPRVLELSGTTNLELWQSGRKLVVECDGFTIGKTSV